MIKRSPSRKAPLVFALTLAVLSAAPIKLAAPGFRVIGLRAEMAEFYTEHAGQQFAAQGIEVATPSKLAALLGFERQKKLLGCDEASSQCLVELANALGAEGLVTGSIARVGRAFQVNVSVLRASDGSVLSFTNEQVSAEEDLLDALTRAAGALSKALRQKLRPAELPPAPAVSASAGPSRRTLSLIPFIAGVGAAVTGVAFTVSSASLHRQLTGGAGASALSPEQAIAARRDGELHQVLAGVSFGVSAACLVTTAALFFSERPPPALVTFFLSGGGAGFALAGSWP